MLDLAFEFYYALSDNKFLRVSKSALFTYLELKLYICIFALSVGLSFSEFLLFSNLIR